MSCYPTHYNVASCKYAHQIKQTTTSYGSAMLNEKGMVPKDKGWGGCQTMVMGEKPMCFHLVVICHLPCLTQPLQCLDFVSWGSYCMRKRGHGEASVLEGWCQYRWYACPAKNHHFSHAWSPLSHSHHRAFLLLVYSHSRREGSVLPLDGLFSPPVDLLILVTT